MKINLKTNIVFENLVDSDKKIIINQGGTRSGKTFNILLYIIFYYCLNNTDKTITICRKTYPALRATVLRDFINILREHNLYNEDNHNKSSSEYNLFGNLIEFISLDQPVKVRGRKRHLLFINEANELFWEDWQQLLFRTSDKIILDYNPSEEYHWIYDKIIPREDANFLKTTYKDNPFLEQSLIDEIERLKYTDEQYWQIYGLGEKGISKATIFDYTECNQVPFEAEVVSFGMDFGFTNDPTALVKVSKLDNNLYIEELLYRTMMTTGDIHNFLKGKVNREPIYADSSEPRIIEELRRMGWGIRASLKGRDSVNAGIDLLKRFKIHIHKDSTNAIQEFRNYKWLEDKTGKLTNKPEDKNNHIADAVRYATYSILSKPNFGKYAIR
jgi:phage terminase large subunit